MSILSSLLNLFKKVLSKVWEAIRDFVKKYWVIILVIVVIWFAPVIAAWLVANSAPAWVIAVFEGLAVATPYLMSGLAWVWEGASGLAAGAWSEFIGYDLIVKSAIVLGTAAAIAPDEAAAVVGEIGEAVASVVTALVVGVASGSGVGPVLLAVGAAGLFLYFRSKDRERAKRVALTSDSSSNNPLLSLE